MFRRNPDLIAVIAIALYFVLGGAGPAVTYYGDQPVGPALRDEIQTVVKAEVRSILRELAFAIRH